MRRPSATCSSSCAASLSHNDHSKLVRVENSLTKWGVENPFQAPEIKQKIKDNPKAKESRYGSDGFTKLMVDRFGVDNAFLMPQAVPGRISKINLQWKNKLEKATGLSWTLEQPINGVRTVDLYVEHEGKKLAVELHPTATHNSHKNLVACNRRGCKIFPCSHSKARNYHQARALSIAEANVQLISVFDWMNEDRVIAFVRGALKLQTRRAYARKCELRRIDQRTANKFLKQYHMLGGSTRQEFCYGLYYEGELVQVQTFVKRTHDWEARRLASKDDWQIIGGISRGTKAFIREAQPAKIVAFSDLSLSIPDFDSRFNGFTEREIQRPVLCWSKGSRMILAKSASWQSADRLLGIAKNSKTSPYGEDLSNEDVFLAEGWLPVWDCGKIKETLIID